MRVRASALARIHGVLAGRSVGQNTAGGCAMQALGRGTGAPIFNSRERSFTWSKVDFYIHYSSGEIDSERGSRFLAYRFASTRNDKGVEASHKSLVEAANLSHSTAGVYGSFSDFFNGRFCEEP